MNISLIRETFIGLSGLPYVEAHVDSVSFYSSFSAMDSSSASSRRFDSSIESFFELN